MRKMNSHTIVGIAFTLVVLGIGVFGYHLLSEEIGALKNAKVYQRADPVGSVVVVEGKVSGKNKILVHDLVHAVREIYSQGAGSRRAGWSLPQEKFNQPLWLDVGAEEVVVNADSPIDRGSHVKIVVDPTNKENRWRGIERGATVTVIGRIITHNPTAIEASIYTYADSRRGYEADASSFQFSFWITMAVAVLIGAAITMSGVYRK
jgi:hypothetical protein